MTASALPQRFFRSRRRRTATSSQASHASWKPPSPFTATIDPARRSCTAVAISALARARSSSGSRCGRGAISQSRVQVASSGSPRAEFGGPLARLR